MRRPEKELLVQEISDKFSEAKSFFLTDFSGLNVEQVTELRNKFRESSVDYQVIKNTLSELALKNIGITNIHKYLTGPTAIAFSYAEPGAPAKIISDFLKAHRETTKPEIKLCILEREILTPAETKELIDLPPREVLIARVLGGLNAPISGLVGSLNGLISKLVRTLKAVEEQKSSAAE